MTRTGLGCWVAIVVCVIAVSGCSPQENGPLEGPRVEGQKVELCAPSSAGRDIYFSEVLANTGDGDVTVSAVDGSGTNLGKVDYFLDTTGPANGQVLATFAGPASQSDAIGAAVLSRMVEAPGVVVAPGQTVALIIHPVPKSGSADAEVSETRVTYDYGGKRYREEVLATYRVDPGDEC